MTPFGDAVGLVNGQAADGRLRQQQQDFRPQQRFRGYIEQLDPPGTDVANRLRVGGEGQRTIQRCRGNPQLAQLLHLILHQRNERRDDHRQPRPEQGGQLVAEGFAAASRHDGQGIPSGQTALNDLFLQRPELIVAKDSFQ